MKLTYVMMLVGIEKWGMVTTKDGSVVYAYEVDGLGKSLVDFDDPNWPSLVSMPLLGWNNYNKMVYENTKSRILSPRNRYWYQGGEFSGLGSPHTATNMAWALGTLSEAMTALTAEEKAKKLKLLLKLQCNDGLMHESIHVHDLNQCTRKWFEWANALLVVGVEHLTGQDCDSAAEIFHRADVARREKSKRSKGGGTLTNDAAQAMAAVAQPVEAHVQYDGTYVEKVSVWKGIGWTIDNQ